MDILVFTRATVALFFAALLLPGTSGTYCRHASAQLAPWPRTAQRGMDAYPGGMIQGAIYRVPPVNDYDSHSAGENRAAGATEQLVQSEQLGSEPEDRTLQFLRRQTPLLAPGDWQLDIGVTYAIAETELPVGVDGPFGLSGVLPGRIRQRLLLVPLELRYGWRNNLQVYASLPFGWSNTERSLLGIDDFSNVGGVGDFRGGITFMLAHGDGYEHPDIVATVGFTAPTGNASLLTTAVTPEAQLGEGFWAASVSVLVLHTYDPLIVYYGLGARHRFDARLDGLGVNPGEQMFYQLGVGFAVNERITLSCAFLGAYATDYEIDGVRLAGSSLEPLQLRTAVTISKNGRLIEPFAEIGMTEDAASARVGIIWTF